MVQRLPAGDFGGWGDLDGGSLNWPWPLVVAMDYVAHAPFVRRWFQGKLR